VRVFRRRLRVRPTDIMCRQAVELMTDYLEGALSDLDRARLEAHLGACPHCTEYLDQIRRTIAAVGRVAPESLAPEALDELVALYRQWKAG
jgi:anti-sigma factor RsiW